MNRWDLYNFDEDTYTVDTKNWNMTVFVESEELLITDPKRVAEILTNGTKVVK